MDIFCIQLLYLQMLQKSINDRLITYQYGIKCQMILNLKAIVLSDTYSYSYTMFNFQLYCNVCYRI